MKIVEIYKSIQGEGSLTGTESVFVRTSGCNLRCWFCDTPYASWQPEGADQSVDEIVQNILDLESEHVVITGGEPMLFSEMIPLCRELRRAKKHITIETAGTLFLPLECDLLSISPKLPSSAPLESDTKNAKWRERHLRTISRTREALVRLTKTYEHQLKFVIDNQQDADELLHFLKDYKFDQTKIWLMPQGIKFEDLAEKEIWLAKFCDEHDFKLCSRKQIEWFGATRCT